MADRGHELTDKLLNDLENRIADEFAVASRDMQKKAADYWKQYEAGIAEQKKLLDAGEITKKDYQDWVYRHTMMGKQWDQMSDVLARDLENATEIALKIARGEMPDVYALNANYATYQIEHDGRIDTGFTLYNHDTAEKLMREQDLQLMPGPATKKAQEIAANKAMQWNKQKIQSAVLQGVLQGESAYQVAKRLQSVAQMGYNSAVRYARTMTTDAQNAGRYESYRRAKRLGVDLTIEWQATLDQRTRHEHRMLHGQRREVDEPFEVDGFSIMWPAQSHGPGSSDIPQSTIWNCRCTLLAWVKGFEGDTVKSSPKMGKLSFEEWQEAKPHPWLASDKEQYERYKGLLKGKAPKSLYEFRQVKADPEKWEALKSLYREKSAAKDVIKLPDIVIGRSVGAKRKSFDILDLETGKRYDLVDGTFIRDVKVFAGKGTKTEYRKASSYASKYGGAAADWQHVKGFATMATEEGDRDAEIHWSQCDGIGRVDFFVKRWLDE